MATSCSFYTIPKNILPGNWSTDLYHNLLGVIILGWKYKPWYMCGMGYEHCTSLTVSSLLRLESQPLWSYLFLFGNSVMVSPSFLNCSHGNIAVFISISNTRLFLQENVYKPVSPNWMLLRVLPSHWVKVRLLLWSELDCSSTTEL